MRTIVMPEKTPEELRKLADILVEVAENITLVEVALEQLQEIDTLKLEATEKQQLKKAKNLLKIFLRHTTEDSFNQVSSALKITTQYREIREM